jgi:predicted GNAT family acetyltransferase
MWPALAPTWGPPRAVRSRQPLLLLDRVDGLPGGDPRVRPIRADEVERYLPAAAAMFTEELEISPYAASRIGDYRRRIVALIAQRRAFGIVDDYGAVIFKADIGAVSGATCQLQGVWVRPDLRGRGLGGAALAAVLRHALTLAPSVSLYVNDYNVAARRMYDRLGLREVATLSTILF